MKSFQAWLRTVLLVPALVLLAGGILFYRVQERRVRQDVESDLQAIAALKANQIVAWRAERLGDAFLLAENALLGSAVAKWMTTSDPGEQDRLLAGFRSLQTRCRYHDVLLVDSDGRLRLSASGKPQALQPELVRALSASLRERKPVFTDLHADELAASPHIDIATPLWGGESETPMLVGAVVLVCDARRFLYPLIQSWPVPSRTAETLLVRRDGNDVLFLNELRHRTNTALKLRIPLIQTNVPGVMAVLGKEGIARGADYRKVEVIAALRPIQDSPWFLVAKVDTAEAFAPWRFSSLLILGLLLALACLVGAAVLAISQRQQKAHYHALYQAEAAQSATEKRYGVILRSIGDAVIATDIKGRVELMNPVAEALTGWRNGEARGKPLLEVFRVIDENTRQPVEDPVARVMREGAVVGLANHTVLIARDGTERAIADSGASIRDKQDNIVGVVLVFREQTEERELQRELRDSEVRYRTLFAESTDGILIADLETRRFKYANPAVCRMLGYAEAELRSMYVPDIHPKEALQSVMAAFEAMAGGKKTLAADIPCLRKDGSVVSVDINGASITIDGKPCNVGFFRDITQRKQADAVLRESQASLESAQSLVRMGSWDLDLAQGAGHWSKEMFRLFDRDPALGAPPLADFIEMVHPDDRERLTETHQRVVESGQQAQREFRTNPSRGPIRHFLATIHVLQESSSPLRRVAGTVQDITERKQAEERIREQAALLDAATDAIYVRALDHTVTYWNDGATRLFGLTPAEVLGRKIPDLLEIRGREAFETAHASLLEQGHWSGELKKINKAGKELIVFCRWTLLRNEQNRPKEILAINTDITEHKQLEANFLRAQRLEGIGALAGGIAHDLNNILQPILMAAPLLKETIADPESRQMLDTIETCAQRGSDIIRQLLTFARGQPGTRLPLPVRHLMDDMDKIIRETFPRSIRPVVHTEKALWPVLGDPTQIHQAIMNLCVNARDAMPEGGTLTLAAKNLALDETFVVMSPDAKAGRYVCVSVTDTGTGIPTEHLDRIFDPFFTTKEIGKGTGLGLATVLGIVRGHGGFIQVNSRAGQGTTFELYLPASPQAEAVGALEREALPPPAHGEMVLVVDDEVSVRGAIQRTLVNHGYGVAIATEGSIAMALFAQRPFEFKAVITDMMMPGMDGLSFIRALRQQAPRLPILAMTGMDDHLDVKKIRALGLPVLLKPFTREELIIALHKAVVAAAEPGRKLG